MGRLWDAVRELTGYGGPPKRPLDGLNAAVLQAVVGALPVELRDVMTAQIRDIAYVIVSDYGDEVYLHERSDAVTAWPGSPAELKVATVFGEAGGYKLDASVWVIKGRLGMIQHSRVVKKILHAPFHVERVRIDNRAPPRPPSAVPSGRTPRLEGWLHDLLAGRHEVTLFPPLSDRVIDEVVHTWSLPNELRMFWQSSDGLEVGPLKMAGPSDVRELELQGHRYLVLGALEHEPIVWSIEPPGFALLADEREESLGADFPGALQRLLAEGE